MELLIERSQTTNIFTEETEAKGRNYYIEGITLQGNIKNGNARIYPVEVLHEGINDHVKSYLDKNRAVGELGHPTANPEKINYDNVSHKFIKVENDGDNFRTKSIVLDTPKGKILKNLIDGGVQFGISSRAFGTTKKDGDTAIVQKIHIVSLGDIEHEPSAPEAFMDAVMEKKDWIYQNGILVGINMEESIDEARKLIDSSSKEQRTKIVVDIFRNYMKKLSK